MRVASRNGKTATVEQSYGTQVLITGVEGFTGRHMLDLLVAELGTAQVTCAHFAPFTLPPDAGRVVLKAVKCDITDPESIAGVVREADPDVVFHFAGLVSVAQSFRAPLSYLSVNVEGTLNLLEAVRRTKPDAKVFVPGSAETYGRVDSDSMPITEDAPQRPSNPYALSKLLQERVGTYYHGELGMQVYLSRTFHSIGPGQGTGFVCSDFAKQIAEAERNPTGAIMKVGNLSARRDFLDVRDLVRAYAAIVEKGKPGSPYNVCSGQSVSVRQVLDTLVSHSKAKVSVEVDTSKLRPVDVPEFLGDNSRLRSETSWAPRIPLDRTLADVLDWWRAHAE